MFPEVERLLEQATPEELVALTAGRDFWHTSPVQTLEEMVANLNQTQPPRSIEFKRDGKFFRVMRRRWHDTDSDRRS